MNAACIFSGVVYKFVGWLLYLGLALGALPLDWMGWSRKWALVSELRSSQLWVTFRLGLQSVRGCLRLTRQLVRQLVHTMFISNIPPSFHLWRKENLVKHQKVSKYATDCGLPHYIRQTSDSSKIKITTELKKRNGNRFPFLIFKPLSYFFEETIRFDTNFSFAGRPVSCLIKPGCIAKEFQEKATQFHGSFHGLKISNWFHRIVKVISFNYEKAVSKVINSGL